VRRHDFLSTKITKGHKVRAFVILCVLCGELLPGPPLAALASACSKDVVARIEMKARQVCWMYRGSATSFIGSFTSGQAISAQMIGQASEYDPRSGAVATSWQPRDPNVEGPGGFFSGDAEAPGLLTFVAPATGPYKFSFSPCAMWGAPGAVKICAR
jgi:hypothetical protein